MSLIAGLRVFVLVAWLAYFFVEKDPRKLMAVLVLLLLFPNVVTLIMGLVGP